MDFAAPHGTLAVDVGRLVVAGWTGRDRDAVSRHVAELAAIGVSPPSATPLFYQVSPALLTQADRITVLGAETSGEAEPFLLRADGRLWIGVGSDHTDRGLEAHSVAHSKQVCAKPVCGSVLPVSDGLGDDAELESWIDEGEGWTRYQRGGLSAILPLGDLLASCPLGEGEAMLCGTLPALGGVRPARAFRARLTVPGVAPLELSYAIETVRVVS